MSWEVQGTYFETCNCDFACPCTITGSPATGELCTFLLALHIQRGNVEGVDVGDCTVVLIAETPKIMGEGGWRLGVIIDYQASEDQVGKLTRLSTGQIGGPIGDLYTVVEERLGVELQPIEFHENGYKHRVKAGIEISVEVEDFVWRGMSEPTRVVGVAHPVNSTLTIARPTSSRIKAFGMEFHTTGKSAFSAPFRWSG